MPKLLNNGMQNINVSGNYSFSATSIDNLGATEYTLVTVLVDRSASLTGYEKDLEKMLETSIKSCKTSPRSENLLVRVVTFNSSDKELHGFKLLSQINTDDYKGKIKTSGSTSLFDTAYQAINTTNIYAETLYNQDFFTNAVIFIITDGADNTSKHTIKSVKDLLETVKKGEIVESISTILIGMTSNNMVNTELQKFKDQAELDHYIMMGDVDSSKLSKLAGYISQSISASSKSLGTGSAAQSLTF